MPDKLRVLLVDDDADFVAAMADRCASHEMRTETAAHEDAAVAQLRKERFDVVFLGRVPPALDGVEALVAIRRVAPFVRVVLLDGPAGQATTGLHKPSKFPELAEKLRQAGALRAVNVAGRTPDAVDAFLDARRGSRAGRPLNTALVGAGRGGVAILRMVQEDALGHFRMTIRGVADVNPDAPGMQYARAHGIARITTDYRELFDISDLDLIVEITGDEEVRDAIERVRPRGVRFIDTFGARLFWELHKAQEAVLAQRAERRRQELAEREHITRIYDSIPDEVVVLDTELRIQHANATFLRKSQLALDDVRGEQCHKVLERWRGRCPVDSNDCPARMAQRDRETHSIVKKFFDDEGHARYAAIVAAPMLDADGEVSGLIEMTRDITHRIRLEEELKASEGRVKHFMELAPLATFVKNRVGQYVEVNRATCELFGRSRAEIVGHTDAELLPPDAADVLREGDSHVFRTREKLTLESDVVLDGRHVLLSTIKYPIVNDRGVVTAVGGVSKDVTEERAVQEKLRVTQEYLQNILDNSPILVVTSDLAGNVVSFNKGAELALGYEAGELIGQPARVLYVDEEERDQLVAHIKEGDTVHDAEVQWRRKDGSAMDTALSLSELRNSRGELIGLVGMARDISHRKALMNQVIQSDRLAAVGRLAAGVAHEINNPLAVIGEIAGYMEDLLLMGDPAVGAELEKELREGLPKIAAQVQRCRSITHRLLNFSRKSTLTEETANVRVALEEALPFLERQAQLAGITIHCAIDDNLPPVRIEEVQFEEIVLNLLKNAMDALAPRGKGNIWVSARRRGKKVLLTIRDDGPGIPKEVRQRIFDPFVTTKPQGQGTGLGLSICYGIAKRHGARIRLSSGPGKGASFVVELRTRETGD